jgi:hypothetical protein
MATYKCHLCGTAARKRTMCGDCRVALEPVCPVCGYGKDYCICSGPMKKGSKPR